MSNYSELFETQVKLVEDAAAKVGLKLGDAYYPKGSKPDEYVYGSLYKEDQYEDNADPEAKKVLEGIEISIYLDKVEIWWYERPHRKLLNASKIWKVEFANPNFDFCFVKSIKEYMKLDNYASELEDMLYDVRSYVMTYKDEHDELENIINEIKDKLSNYVLKNQTRP